MKTVLANGCFDGLHIGHLIHLKAAKELGTVLIVALTNDESVRREKGFGRPFFNQEDRCTFLQEQRFVDGVVIVPDLRTALKSVKPDIFVKGPDYNISTIDDDTLYFCSANNIDIRFTKGPKFSSTALLSQLYK